jgi:hypothetical protein
MEVVYLLAGVALIGVIVTVAAYISPNRKFTRANARN